MGFDGSRKRSGGSKSRGLKTKQSKMCLGILSVNLRHKIPQGALFYNIDNLIGLKILLKSMGLSNNWEEKIMQTYYKEIAENVRERRTKGEYSQREMEIYREGKKDALLSVLIEMQESNTYAALQKRVANMKKFLDVQKHGGKLATEEGEKDIWCNPTFFWTPEELMNFIFLMINDYRMRLKKAREIHQLQSELLRNVSELSIGGVDYAKNES